MFELVPDVYQLLLVEPYHEKILSSGVCDQIRLKPVYSATDAVQWVDSLLTSSLIFVLPMQITTKH